MCEVQKNVNDEGDAPYGVVDVRQLKSVGSSAQVYGGGGIVRVHI